jgi:hypothetical protein
MALPLASLNSFRGLRQGDPLFLLLFFIVMEVLSRIILAAVSGGLWYGFSMGTRIDISHLFPDDTLLLCGTDPNHVRNL